ncbi:unnamed protein product [Onchocerca flexuosa]|uniref:Beta_helix domain-containing protein n=1 Tax=Onchocerca flexuosa TaxID=387005 RepID=A0A183GYE0_9BILA|nr:unnamed protein product [Onchocerca flexuosa]
MMYSIITYILPFMLVFTILSASAAVHQKDHTSFILVPHGLSPDSAERVIIPAAISGPQPPFPCLVAGIGTYEHGQTFTKEHFHYKCNNGTAEVIEIGNERYYSNYYYLTACVADDKSVIHLGRMFIRAGVKHKCDVKGDTMEMLDENKSTCYDNGIHYDVGEHFRNGSFVLVCQKDGITIEGCYARNTDITIPIGTERILDHYLHKCELLDQGRVRYTANLIGCKKDNEFFNEGQIWTTEHIRYQCTSYGIVRVLGCVDDNGLFIELGRDILIRNIVHRCYRIDKTTVYHRFACAGRTIAECILTSPLQRPSLDSET